MFSGCIEKSIHNIFWDISKRRTKLLDLNVLVLKWLVKTELIFDSDPGYVIHMQAKDF